MSCVSSADKVAPYFPPYITLPLQAASQNIMRSILLHCLAVVALVAGVTSRPGHVTKGDHYEAEEAHDDKHQYKVVDYYAEPHYEFVYEVHDPHSHDVKSAHETRKGDTVKGYYKVFEPDGTIREVHYTADDKNGFNAEVTKTGHAKHPETKEHKKDHY